MPLQSKYQTRLRTLRHDWTPRATRPNEAASSANSDMLNSAASVLGGLLGGRRSVSSMSTAARRASSAKSRADAAAAKVDDVQAQIQNPEADLTDELHALHAEWQGKAAVLCPWRSLRNARRSRSPTCDWSGSRWADDRPRAGFLGIEGVVHPIVQVGDPVLSTKCGTSCSLR